jgi:16S rRNA (adenine1518-N6/adenine1519-N6)-dimethyltransferase
MSYPKKSLGQNFLIDKNIVNKILNLTDFKNKNILEIGSGKGALTEKIIKKNPKSLILFEKDFNLAKKLELKYSKEKYIKIINEDFLKSKLNSFKKKYIVIGNLPYNISSQILIKILKEKNLSNKYFDLIFMFQKELGNKIIGKFPSKNYGRLSIIANLKLKISNKFLVSANCFYPVPKVTSMVIHFKPKKKLNFKIKKISNLEKVTNILWSNKRKMINKNIKKILNEQKLKKIPNLNTTFRPENIKPEIYYRITELYEMS